jgi:hypothetical protein
MQNIISMNMALNLLSFIDMMLSSENGNRKDDEDNKGHKHRFSENDDTTDQQYLLVTWEIYVFFALTLVLVGGVFGTL